MSPLVLLHFTSMSPENIRRNKLIWIGLLLTIAAVLSQGLYFTRLPGQHVFPWLNLALAIVAVILLTIGLLRAFRQPDLYRGKISGSISTLLAVVILIFTVTMFVDVRNVPASAGAPKVGQKAPDFMLSDIHGQNVSLSQSLSSPEGGAPPKATLRVFYRGYWRAFCT